MNLFKYIRGERKGKEANRLEKAAMRDPLLGDALDGYTKVKGDHLEAVEALQRRVSRRSLSRKRLIWSWGVAASLLVGVFIGGYYLLQPEQLQLQEQMIALETDILIRDTILGGASGQQEELLSRMEEPPVHIVKPKKDSPLQEVPELLPEVPPVMEIQDSMDVEEVSYVPVEMEAEEEAAVMADSAPSLTPEPEKAAKVARSAILPGKSDGKIRGQVTDHDGEPLIGVNVQVEGTTRGTLTDINGHFTLETSPGEFISFNYIGYDRLTLPVDTGSQLMIAMNEDRRALDEVVVVAYGTQKKKKERVKTPKPVAGEKAYQQYLKANLRSPGDGACKDVKGKVILSFYVDGTGRPDQIKVEKSLCLSADEEAARLVREGPDWTAEMGEVKLEIKF